MPNSIAMVVVTACSRGVGWHLNLLSEQSRQQAAGSLKHGCRVVAGCEPRMAQVN